MNLPTRKPNRLAHYDYSQNGAYFITMCTQSKAKTLSNVGVGVLDDPQSDAVVTLLPHGKTVENQIREMNDIYKNLSIEKYVIMPNHIHLIIMITASESGSSGTPTPTNAAIPQFVSTFKRFTNRRANFDIWQRSYYDHVIRDEPDYLKIWNYVDTNPARWREDRFYIE